MATRGQLKSVEFKQAELSPASAGDVAEAAATIPASGNSAAVLKAASIASPAAPPTAISTTKSASPVATAAMKGSPMLPRFTAEETILLRGLASGASSREMAAQMRLPRESLYRLIGDLRRKTGATSDTALAVWVLRNMGTAGGERRGGGR
jgi:DNA-binding CsgD family transcriptional regulator